MTGQELFTLETQEHDGQLTSLTMRVNGKTLKLTNAFNKEAATVALNAGRVHDLKGEELEEALENFNPQKNIEDAHKGLSKLRGNINLSERNRNREGEKIFQNVFGAAVINETQETTDHAPSEMETSEAQMAAQIS